MTASFECSESLSRRSFLKATAVLTFAGLPNLSFAGEVTDRRLLVVLLRGGLDGLSAMPAIGDPGLKGRRRHLMPDGLLKLDGFFALHPSLVNIHDAYDNGQGLFVHGTSFPYTGRSHFEGQDIMETGVLKPYSSNTGWLGRALDASGYRAVALALPVPLILRGHATAESRYPTWISSPPDAVYDRLGKLWAEDPDTAPFGAQLASNATESVGMNASIDVGSPVDMKVLALQAALQLREPNGPRVAVLDDVGFDSHASEPNEYSRLLSEIDDAIGIFKHSIGDEAWKNTLVVTVTEFGRTVAENGSWGTDHGWGSCAFVVGGALKKSGIVTDWPGLKAADLFEGRDLKMTIDVRSLYARIVTASLGIDPEIVQRDIIESPKDDRFDAYI
ncbi:MAG TPA: DUF1501 domain-containing protein [Bauldia sp.]|nr:DUF1501 domain-containing protein [Bauldia sp.]